MCDLKVLVIVLHRVTVDLAVTAFELSSNLMCADHVLDYIVARGSSNIANFTSPRLSNFERSRNDTLFTDRAAVVTDCLKELILKF